MATAVAPERVRESRAPARAPDFDRRPQRAAPAAGQRGPRWSLPRTAAMGGVIVLVSLLMVVAASAYMTQGQVRLTRLQGQLTAVLGQHHDLEWRMAQLSDPSKVVSQSQQHGLVAPDKVTDLTQVNAAQSVTTTSTAGHASVTSTAHP